VKLDFNFEIFYQGRHPEQSGLMIENPAYVLLELRRGKLVPVSPKRVRQPAETVYGTVHFLQTKKIGPKNLVPIFFVFNKIMLKLILFIIIALMIGGSFTKSLHSEEYKHPLAALALFYILSVAVLYFLFNLFGFSY